MAISFSELITQHHMYQHITRHTDAHTGAHIYSRKSVLCDRCRLWYWLTATLEYVYKRVRFTQSLNDT